MKILNRLQSIVILLKKGGVDELWNTLNVKFGVPISSSARWRVGIRQEILFWREYFSTKGLHWPKLYQLRFDPELPLQKRIADHLPSQKIVKILDVGAGPLTYLGKKHPTCELQIIAVDPLAEIYSEILDEFKITPLIRTQKAAAEQLTRSFSRGQFDLVFARNCIDHSTDPILCVEQMLEVVKPGGWVLMEHCLNEGVSQNYEGLHQWNFSIDSKSHFIISSRNSSVDMTLRLKNRAIILCKIEKENPESEGVQEILITRIQKKSS